MHAWIVYVLFVIIIGIIITFLSYPLSHTFSLIISLHRLVEKVLLLIGLKTSMVNDLLNCSSPSNSRESPILLKLAPSVNLQKLISIILLLRELKLP